MKTRTAHYTLLLICTCIGFCKLNFMFSLMSSQKHNVKIQIPVIKKEMEVSVKFRI